MTDTDRGRGKKRCEKGVRDWLRAVWIEGAVNRVVYVPVAGTQGIIKFRTRPWENYLGGHRGVLRRGKQEGPGQRGAVVTDTGGYSAACFKDGGGAMSRGQVGSQPAGAGKGLGRASTEPPADAR